MTSKALNRKMELIFVVVLHIANKVLDDEAMMDLKHELDDVNSEHVSKKKLMN